MRISRIYLPISKNQIIDSIIIDGEKAHYLKNVLRVKANQQLNFFTPDGIEYNTKVALVEKKQITLTDIQALGIQPKPSSMNITLIQGISSSDRMDYTIQKSAELGCQKFIPVLTDFCAHKIPAHKFDKKLNHWRAVAISGCEQSGRTDVLEVLPICHLKEVVGDIEKAIYLEPTANNYIPTLPSNHQQQTTILIGPEGGFSPTELTLFESKNYLGIQLGQRVLRTETVAPVILSALHSLYGDFKPPVE